jgi:hypothetical protein
VVPVPTLHLHLATPGNLLPFLAFHSASASAEMFPPS